MYFTFSKPSLNGKTNSAKKSQARAATDINPKPANKFTSNTFDENLAITPIKKITKNLKSSKKNLENSKKIPN